MLKNFDPNFTEGCKQDAKKEIKHNLKLLNDLGYRLYAENRRSLLLILQGMDTAGKDGTICHVMKGFNPQGCQVTSFKAPGGEEANHDFLWRINKALPPKGHIGIFNRSHYEDVLIVRVHNLVPKDEWQARYDQINQFESLLESTGTTIVKVFLHISKEEQRERLQARLNDPDKVWKFNSGDLKEREYWEEYRNAYETVFDVCREPQWHIVPANHKWYRNLVVSRILCETLQKMDPQFPKPCEDLSGIKL